MKIRILPILALCAFAAILILAGCSRPVSVMASVDFGNPPKGGGACSGRGICSVAPVASGDNTVPVSATAIQVTFKVSPDRNTLFMVFSLLAVNQKQPQQAPLINPSITTYQFEGEFPLTGAVFTPLNLLPNAKIDPSSQSTLTINGDEVTMSFKYSHT